MREASGNTFVFYMILIFILIIIALIVGSLSYSKSYKVKNLIVNTIQNDGGWFEPTSCETIESSLISVGYRNTANAASFDEDSCEEYVDDIDGVSSAEVIYPSFACNSHTYCVIKYKLDDKGGEYYKVVTFTHFDIPVIGSFLEFPIEGETMILNKGYLNSKE